MRQLKSRGYDVDVVPVAVSPPCSLTDKFVD